MICLVTLIVTLDVWLLGGREDHSLLLVFALVQYQLNIQYRGMISSNLY